MSQIKCGLLTTVANDANGIKFRGNITLGDRLDHDVMLVTNPRANEKSDAPDFDVVARRKSFVGSFKPIGGAWLKNSSKVNGGDFVTMTLDDPDWPNEIFVTAFPPDKGNDWRIVWSRPRGARVQSEPAREQETVS